jgi:ABC-type multidrug transport system permease subunit
MSLFRVVGHDAVDTEALTELRIDDLIEAVRENRSKLRNIVSSVITVSGLLLSATLVILFFMLNNKMGVSLAYGVLLGTVVCLVSGMAFAVRAIHLPLPKPAATKGDRLQVQLAIYSREYRQVNFAVWLLFLAIILFVAALAVFGLEIGAFRGNS